MWIFLIIEAIGNSEFSKFLFWNETLHVSDSSSVHHQGFFYCTHSNGIFHTGLLTACEQEHLLLLALRQVTMN
jgi:hypothetical protein